jgi:hypothetical protein
MVTNVVLSRVQTVQLTRFVLPMTRFDGLCLEAVDVANVAAFWRFVLEGSAHSLGDSRFRVDPAAHRPSTETMRINAVPSPSPDRSRVHLDIWLPGDDPQHLLDAGARLIRTPGADPWYVLEDPEGNQFCAFPAMPRRPPGIFEVVVKCRDAHWLARWWSTVLDGEFVDEGDAAVVCGAPDFPWEYLVFDPVPEPKLSRNRLHWHVTLRDPDPSTLVAIGATVLRSPDATNDWWVLADPEGNEFCATPSP